MGNFTKHSVTHFFSWNMLRSTVLPSFIFKRGLTDCHESCVNLGFVSIFENKSLFSSFTIVENINGIELGHMNNRV